MGKLLHCLPPGWQCYVFFYLYWHQTGQGLFKKIEMKMINTWLYGRGIITSSGTGSDGVRYWYAVFPGFGVQRVTPAHLAGMMEKTAYAYFSLN